MKIEPDPNVLSPMETLVWAFAELRKANVSEKVIMAIEASMGRLQADSLTAFRLCHEVEPALQKLTGLWDDSMKRDAETLRILSDLRLKFTAFNAESPIPSPHK